MSLKQHDIAVRIQALALAEEGIKVARITEITGLSRRTIFYLKKRARDRGYDPARSRVLKMEYVEDAPRSGRPRVAAGEKDGELLGHVGSDDEGGVRSAEEFGRLVGGFHMNGVQDAERSNDV
jgi:transposase